MSRFLRWHESVKLWFWIVALLLNAFCVVSLLLAGDWNWVAWVNLACVVVFCVAIGREVGRD